MPFAHNLLEIRPFENIFLNKCPIVGEPLLETRIHNGLAANFGSIVCRIQLLVLVPLV